MPPPDSQPTPDSFGPGGGFLPQIPRLLVGAGLTAGLTIGGLKALQPKYGQDTDPRSNTPTGHSAVSVVKKKPQVVLTQTLYNPTAAYPLEYKVEVADGVTEVLVGTNNRPSSAKAIKLDSTVFIGHRDADQFPLRLTQPDGSETTLSIAAGSSTSLFAYDVVASASEVDDTWSVTPVTVWLGRYKGTFYVFSK